LFRCFEVRSIPEADQAARVNASRIELENAKTEAMKKAAEKVEKEFATSA